VVFGSVLPDHFSIMYRFKPSKTRISFYNGLFDDRLTSVKIMPELFAILLCNCMTCVLGCEVFW